MVKEGKQRDEVFEWMQKNLEEKVVEKHLTAASFKITQSFLSEVTPLLSEEQKKKLAQLFLIP